MYQFPERDSTVVAVHATLSADNTPAAIDLRGYEAAQILVGVGVGGITFDGTNKLEIKLRKGDGTVGGHTAVAASDVILPAGFAWSAGGIIRNLIAAHAAATFITVDYINQDPAAGFVSILADFSGTHGTGTPLFLAVRRLRHRLNPPV
jgi:hypothetical protein